MITAVIIDDEALSRKDLKDLLKHETAITVSGEAGSVSEGIVLIQASQPALVFLDIEMPDGTGFDLLEQLKQAHFQVIFTTGHNEYAIKAFKHSAIDYLLKPIDPLELKSALERVVVNQTTDQNNEKLSLMLKSLEQKEFSKIDIPSMDSFEFINKKEIVFCEADGNYSHIYLLDGRKIVSTHPLKKLEDILSESNFFRIHKSFIININFIKKVLKVEGGQIIMDNDLTIPIARRRKDEFLALMGL